MIILLIDDVLEQQVRLKDDIDISKRKELIKTDKKAKTLKNARSQTLFRCNLSWKQKKSFRKKIILMCIIFEKNKKQFIKIMNYY